MKLFLPAALLSLPAVTSSWSIVPRRSRSLLGPSSLLDSTMMTPYRDMIQQWDRDLQEMDRYFGSMNLQQRTKPTNYEFIDNDEEMKITIDLPGVKADDVTVQVDSENHVLSISGQRKSKDENSYSSYEFSNRFSVSPAVELDQFVANLEDGVLTVTAPKDMKKLESQQQVRKIPITSSATTESEPQKIEAAAAPTKQEVKVDMKDAHVKEESKV